ncbi:MAG: T9SS type A sorting domain-containing protein [Ignavibacteriaceae bacterium]|nr:T9SS type A sorting domain-containing protein [Ignavibacteriaceae bacterium]
MNNARVITFKKLNSSFLLFSLFIAFISVAFYFEGESEYDRNGGTQLNGNGCVCHNVNASPDVTVWIEGPDTVVAGEMNLFAMYLAGGPAEAGGYNVAGRFGEMFLVDTLSVKHPLEPNELTQAFPLPFPTNQDTIYWEFGYVAFDSTSIDTIYSVGLSIKWDSIPDFHDKWQFGPKHPLVVLPSIIPVELEFFNARVDKGKIVLEWSTETELNNLKFEVERSENEGKFFKIGEITGSGTTLQNKSYKFVDYRIASGKLNYRLKQLDYDGSYKYSETISVIAVNEQPDKFFELSVYPNPFNPATKIQISLFDESEVKISVFNSNGEMITELMNDKKSKGLYAFQFNAEDLTSGVYFIFAELKSTVSGKTSKLAKKLLFLK